MNLSQLQTDRCNDWALDDLRFTDGLELHLERWMLHGVDIEGTRPKCRVHFQSPASWAFSDLSRMWQYYPDDDCPPVIEMREHDNDETFSPGFTLNLETFASGWKYFRVNAGDDVIDVVTQVAPTVTA